MQEQFYQSKQTRRTDCSETKTMNKVSKDLVQSTDLLGPTQLLNDTVAQDNATS